MNCPQDGRELEFISGTFGTGVYHPDGGQESVYEEGMRCPKCRTVYDESEIEDECLLPLEHPGIGSQRLSDRCDCGTVDCEKHDPELVR